MSYGMEGPCVGRIGPGVSLCVGGGVGGGGRAKTLHGDTVEQND